MPAPKRLRKMVLLVEDNVADRDLYGGLLWYNGYDVVYATEGEDAVAKALQFKPDLILLDIMLPGGPDGIRVAKRLREKGVRVPILALSARSEEELGVVAREAGMVAFLEKPIDPFVVVREVSSRIGYAPGQDDPSRYPSGG